MTTDVETQEAPSSRVAPRDRLWVRRRRGLRRTLVFTSLIAFLVVFAAPYVYTMTGSFKLNAELFVEPIRFLPQDPTLTNYTDLLTGVRIPFLRQFINSLVISTGAAFAGVFLSSTVGWGFAKFEFKGKKLLFILLIASLTLPFQVVIVPLFLLMENVNLTDTYTAVILPAAVSAFGSFFMRQAMVGIPDELLNAARVDGASEWGVFWRIGVPMVKGPISVLAVILFVTSWNDFLWPLIALRSTEMFTYPIGLASLVGGYRVEFGMALAGTALATIPIFAVFIAGRKRILENFTTGAVKT